MDMGHRVRRGDRVERGRRLVRLRSLDPGGQRRHSASARFQAWPGGTPSWLRRSEQDAPSAPDAPGAFARRVFWVKEHDRSRPDGVYNSGALTEAVDPRTVAPGVWGELTEPAWGGELS
ncbi:DUF6009 family protein [Streptomyces sp. NPDC056222]|uniref:DUF6009 family protein n=1 Tax=Streptomyces sp. NPDC056222 TaxID=3345749 RepID=UPI0035DD9CF3